MQVIFRKDPIVPSVEAMENLQKNVDYWGDKCCKAEAEAERMRAALVQIRDEAATKQNGGSWAAGIATLCLATVRF